MPCLEHGHQISLACFHWQSGWPDPGLRGSGPETRSGPGSRDSPSRPRTVIWNRDRLYEIMDFGTYMYVLVCTEYILVRNTENGTYLYVTVCTKFVQVL